MSLCRAAAHHRHTDKRWWHLATLRRPLDVELVRRQFVTSRAEAQEAIANGFVTVDGAPALKPGTQVSAAQAVSLKRRARRFVSRGGEKLAHALTAFDIPVAGRVCLDAGVSTGGFTDVLLQAGASTVWAFDVGYGQIHESLRTDPRVYVRERTNVRDITAEHLDGAVPDLLVADVSFVSLTKILAPLKSVLAADAEAIVLVKPQFEANRDDIERGGVVRDSTVWRRVITDVIAYGATLGWYPQGITVSPVTGPKGNVEFLLHFAPEAALPEGPSTIAAAVEQALGDGHTLQTKS